LVHRELVDALFDTTIVKGVVEEFGKSGSTMEEMVQKLEQLFNQIAVAYDAQNCQLERTAEEDGVVVSAQKEEEDSDDVKRVTSDEKF
jgi:hypothetical protein